MNAAQVHLMLNHIPILGILFGTVLLAFSRWGKKPEYVRLCLVVFVLTGLVAIAVYLSGEGAEEIVEHVPGVSEHFLEEHEDTAFYAYLSALALGLVSLAALVVSKWRDRLVSVALVLSVVASGLMVWAGSLGGKINHPEIRSEAASLSVPSKDEDDTREEPHEDN